ncbi:MAG: polysaccharide deacetylase family protein [Phycisphaerae bacterium]|nr:polysaccharide deacetylase family protein [Phycisphaerae bacterium]
MINALTVDVEDYWSIISRDWLKIPDAEPTDAVVGNTKWFLKTLEEHRTKATFFILGEVAQKFPSLVRDIHTAGHEVGVHGFLHKQIFKLTPDAFSQEVSQCKKLLEDLTGAVVVGHRAPAFSMMPQTQWAFDVLCDAGFQYDSSVFPISGRRYGWPDFSNGICTVQTEKGNSIIEVPMSVLKWGRRSFPVAGGGYLRHFPYGLNQWAIKRVQRCQPVVVYMHPYEIEPPVWSMDTSRLSLMEKIQLYKLHAIQMRNRKTVARKVIRLLNDFQFTSIADLLKKSSVCKMREHLFRIDGCK